MRKFGTVLLAIAVVAGVSGPALALATAVAAGHTHACGAGKRARCGTVAVPLDRTRPGSGTLHIGYERYPRTDRTHPSMETIVAIEGGPGYPTTESRSYYLGLFRPMMDRHDLLLVDLRGTGTSGAIDCEPLQSLRVAQYSRWVRAVGKCGRQLGRASDLYGTAKAADDLADVLDALGISRVDLYGDSYGTFFSQTFAIRHPDRLRSLVLDAAYPVEGADPWWRDLSRAAAKGYRQACERDPGCESVGGDPVHRLALLDRRVALHPITGVAPDADGRFRRVTVGPGFLISIYDSGGYGFDVYRELDAAVRAALRPDPDYLPLLRLAREEIYLGGGGPVKYYSQGLADAVECTDYPQLYDMMAPPKVRYRQYGRAIRALEKTDPRAFAPFTVQQWITSPDEDYDTCLRWPVPDDPQPLMPRDHAYPDVPTLVLVGDLDSVTSAQGARQVAGRFPASTFVEVANMVHVSALADTKECAAGIVLRFVRTLSAGNTSCAAMYPEVREVDAFALRAGYVPGPIIRRASLVAANTVADVMARWDNMAGDRGVGLRGGTFVTRGDMHRSWRLHDVRWVQDVAVSGTVTLDAPTGAIHAVVTLTGSGVPHGPLDIRWNSWKQLAQAKVRGRVGTRAFTIVVPAP